MIQKEEPLALEVEKKFDGIFYLHAEDSRTPKEMYARMGFETVKRTYEYYLEWEESCRR